MNVKDINVSSISKSENYRTRKGDLAELMLSIKENGLLQPIGVKKVKGNNYQIVFGNRRLAAYKKLGKKMIPCTIIDDSKSNVVLNLIENIQREDASLFEVGRAIHKLKKEGLSESEIMVRLSVTKGYVRSSIDTFKMTPIKYRDKVVNMDNIRKSNKQGLIPSTVASIINRTSQRHNLKKKDIEEFYSHVSANETSAQDATVIVKMMGNGLSLKESLKSKDKVKCFRASIVMKQVEYDRLLNKYGRNFIDHIISKQKYDKVKPISNKTKGKR